MAKNISISPFIFQRCFQQAWSGSQRARVNYGNAKYGKRQGDDDFFQLPRSFGIAVSGGADSMALAYLCKQLESSPELAGAISVTAFVVDHRARPESTIEAEKVAGWLRDMKIKTQILKLDWAELTSGKGSSSLNVADPSMLSAFETHARRLRFQALGLACHKFKLEALLLGHHQDDNVETTIWRLSSGAKGLGLGGIPEVARIPECHGLFGASESWSVTSIPVKPDGMPQQRVRFNDRNHGLITFSGSSNEPENTKNTNGISSENTSPVKIASPGTFICRPLLHFTKDSILETCRKNQIPYVSDPTNFDPTLTPRNAIRSLRTSKSLPRALESQSILSLVRSSQDLARRSNELSDSLLSSQCRILDFNPKAGSAVIQFSDSSPASLDPQLASLSASQAREIQTLVLRRITELVSPFPDSHVPLRNYEPFISSIFSGPENDNAAKKHDLDDSSHPRKPFTLAGVLFQPLTNEATAPAFEDKAKQSQPRGASIWLLSRQPFMKDREPVTQINVSPLGNFTPWLLWDNRFWMRLRLVPSDAKCDLNELGDRLSHVPLTIRPFHKLDVERVRRDTVNSRPQGTKKNPSVERDISGTFENMKTFLSVEAPSKLRFTLPVVTREGINFKPGKPLDQKVRQQLALPTLDYRLSAHFAEYASQREVELVHLGWRWKLKWQWMYKMIDIEALSLMGWPAVKSTEDA